MSGQPKQKMSPAQRLILSALLFFAILFIGFFILLLAGKMAIPI